MNNQNFKIEFSRNENRKPFHDMEKSQKLMIFYLFEHRYKSKSLTSDDPNWPRKILNLNSGENFESKHMYIRYISTSPADLTLIRRFDLSLTSVDLSVGHGLHRIEISKQIPIFSSKGHQNWTIWWRSRAIFRFLIILLFGATWGTRFTKMCYIDLEILTLKSGP